MERKLRILSIDGGGIRGVFSTTLLIEIEKLLQQEYDDKSLVLADYFDLIAGTSTGGIITCCMLFKNDNKYMLSLSDIQKMYINHGNDIFKKRNILGKIKTCFGLFGSKYDNNSFKSLLLSTFKNCELKDFSKPCLITAYDIGRREFRFFKQHKAILDVSENFLVRDVVMSTVSAPTYFPPSNIKSFSDIEYNLIDGGLFSNNPTYCAFIEAIKIFKCSTEDIKVLSIGSGIHDESYTNTKKWGILKWISPIIDITLSSNLMLADYFMKKMYEGKDNYLRLNIELDKKNSVMDNTNSENIEELQIIAKRLFEINKDKIKNFLQL